GGNRGVITTDKEAYHKRPHNPRTASCLSSSQLICSVLQCAQEELWKTVMLYSDMSRSCVISRSGRKDHWSRRSPVKWWQSAARHICLSVCWLRYMVNGVLSW